MWRKAGEWSSTREVEFQAVAAVGNRFWSGEQLKWARGWAEDEARQMLVGGIDDRQPEMAGAATGRLSSA